MVNLPPHLLPIQMYHSRPGLCFHYDKTLSNFTPLVHEYSIHQDTLRNHTLRGMSMIFLNLMVSALVILYHGEIKPSLASLI